MSIQMSKSEQEKDGWESPIEVGRVKLVDLLIFSNPTISAMSNGLQIAK